MEEFRKMPILEIALERAAIKSRSSTYYEWREKDKEFAKRADQAIAEGEAVLTDMSKSQLISMNYGKNISQQYNCGCGSTIRTVPPRKSRLLPT